jgi:hypothetical protein
MPIARCPRCTHSPLTGEVIKCPSCGLDFEGLGPDGQALTRPAPLPERPEGNVLPFTAPPPKLNRDRAVDRGLPFTLEVNPADIVRLLKNPPKDRPE